VFLEVGVGSLASVGSSTTHDFAHLTRRNVILAIGQLFASPCLAPRLDVWHVTILNMASWQV
jgi:hypothetical protein